jgi:hypothetical protein
MPELSSSNTLLRGSRAMASLRPNKPSSTSSTPTKGASRTGPMASVVSWAH